MDAPTLRAERARRDWTQAELAHRAQVSVDTVQRAERGARILPALLAAIVSALRDAAPVEGT